MEKVSYSVPGIHCEGCAQRIHENLDEAPGIEQVDIDIPHKRIFVVFDQDRTSPEAVGALINESGFAPDESTAPQPVHLEAPAPTRHDAPGKLAKGTWYWLLALGVAVLALAGYVGYELYPRFDLPAAQGGALLLLAAGAGIASFFSPCAFPLLVTLLARETGVEAQGQGRPVERALGFASALSVGAAAFLLIVGVGIALGAGSLFANVTFTSPAGMTLRVVVGATLIVLGLIQMEVLHTPFHAVERVSRPLMQRQAKLRRQNPALGFGLFGFGYLLAGFG